MNHSNTKVRCLYVYFVNGKTGFWVFSGGLYHHFIDLGDRFAYVRWSRSLPAQAYGTAVDVPADCERPLADAGRPHGVTVAFYNNAEAAVQAELKKRHTQHIYGLSSPGGYFIFEPSNEEL